MRRGGSRRRAGKGERCKVLRAARSGGSRKHKSPVGEPVQPVWREDLSRGSVGVLPAELLKTVALLLFDILI